MIKLTKRNYLIALVLSLAAGGIYFASAGDEAKLADSSLVAIQGKTGSPGKSLQTDREGTEVQVLPSRAVSLNPAKRPVDIMERAVAAQKSSDPIEVYTALQLASECQGVLNMQEQFQLFAAGPGIKTLLGGQYSESRRKAVEALLGRCGKFIQAGKVFTSRLVVALKGRGKQLSEDFVTAPKDEVEVGRRGLKMIQSGEPVVADIGLASILPAVKIVAVESDSRTAHIVSLAMLGAVCDFGVDCSSGGVKMATMCALSGICETDWTEFLLADLSESEKPQFYRAKEQYVNWLKTLDAEGSGKLEFKPNT